MPSEPRPPSLPTFHHLRGVTPLDAKATVTRWLRRIVLGFLVLAVLGIVGLLSCDPPVSSEEPPRPGALVALDR